MIGGKDNILEDADDIYNFKSCALAVDWEGVNVRLDDNEHVLYVWQ